MRSRRITELLLPLLLLVERTLGQQVLLPFASTWRYYDGGSAPAGWFRADFDDGDWHAGASSTACAVRGGAARSTLTLVG
jgi:hypothetical protein